MKTIAPAPAVMYNFRRMKNFLILPAILAAFSFLDGACVVEERTYTSISVDPAALDDRAIDEQYNEKMREAVSSSFDWESRLWLGDYHFFRLGNPKEALRWYEEASRINPKSAAAAFKTGVANAALENRDAALRAFERAVECDPGYAEAYLNLSRVYEEKKDFERAAEYRKKYFENSRPRGMPPE
jgi:tetratricopeptide (TPR) repeat protein